MRKFIYSIILYGSMLLTNTLLATDIPLVKNISTLQKIEHKIQQLVPKLKKTVVEISYLFGLGSGSGVIINQHGVILTAAHVVGDKKYVLVTLYDGSKVKARVLGINYSRDIAMCQLLSNKAQYYAKLPSDKNSSISVGEFVIALGHSGGFDAKRGSNLRFGRILDIKKNDFLVSDCSLIGGDSGGGLFNLQGELIGIHSYIRPSLKANNHTSINNATNSWQKLVAGNRWGNIQQFTQLQKSDIPALGIELKQIRVPSSGRVVLQIARTVDSSPAAKAGIQKNDIILAIDKAKIFAGIRDFHRILLRKSPGDAMVITILRNNKVIKKKVNLWKRNEVF